MSARARRQSFLEELRRELALVRRRFRLQRAVARSTPPALDLREALEVVFVLGPTRRVETSTPANPPAAAAMPEPVIVAPAPPRALDAAEIVERILRNCVERTAPRPPGAVN